MKDKTQADVLVIGGGLAGLSISYQLAKSGLKPILIEAKGLMSGTTSACAGRVQIFDSHPGSYLDLVWSGYKYLQTFGDELEFNLELNNPGHLALIKTKSEWDALQIRVEELNQRGIQAEMIDLTGLNRLEPRLNTKDLFGAALAFEGHLNIFNLGQGLAKAACRLGAKLFTYQPVIGITIRREKIIEVSTTQMIFSPKVIIFAVGAWSSNLLSKVNLSIPIKFTQAEAMITEPISQTINHHVGMAGFYETVHGKNRKVAFGIGQHPNGTMFVSNAIQPASDGENGVKLAKRSTAWALPALTEAMYQHFPSLTSARVTRTWSAPSPFLPDNKPVIGWADLGNSKIENLYLAAGFHLAIPTISKLACSIAQEISGDKPSINLSPFRPSRWNGEINN